MRRVFRIAALSVLLLGICGGGYALYMYDSFKDTVSSIYEPLEPVQAEEEPMTASATPSSGRPGDTVIDVVNEIENGLLPPENAGEGVLKGGRVDLGNKEPFTLLIMGVDERSGDRGRSDTIIVLGVNPAKQSILMFNIPRDTRAELAHRGKLDKINHAYAFGGTNMAVDTVENFLNVPINYYVKVNMEGFAQIIDILGGVEIDNEFEFRYEGVTYPKGKLSLDGRDALMYTRMRYDDPRGDFGRNGRQQSVLANLIERAKRIATVTKIPGILNQVEENTRTNLTLDDIVDIYNNYRRDAGAIDKDFIKGTGSHIDGIYYYVVDDQEKQRMHAKLVEHLQ